MVASAQDRGVALRASILDHWETMGEDPYTVERTYGGKLTTDAFVRMHAGGPNGQPTHTPKADRDNVDRIEGDIFVRRTERRRIAAICIYRLIMSSVEEEQSPEEIKRQEQKRRERNVNQGESSHQNDDERLPSQRVSHQPGYLTRDEVSVLLSSISRSISSFSVIENQLARLSGEVTPW